jgi:hypothetical protein
MDDNKYLEGIAGAPDSLWAEEGRVFLSRGIATATSRWWLVTTCNGAREQRDRIGRAVVDCLQAW